MRPLVRTCGDQQASLRIPQPRDCVRYAAVCDQHAVIFIHRNQTAIKHPVDRSGQREAISNTVRAAMRYRANMRGLNLRASTAVEKLETGHGTGILVSCLDGCGESSVPERALHDLSHDPTVDAVDLVRRLRVIAKSYARPFDRIRCRALSITISKDMSKAGRQDDIVLGVGNISHGAAERTFVG